jgi:hypothetical protein
MHLVGYLYEENVAEFTKQVTLYYDNRSFLILYNVRRRGTWKESPLSRNPFRKRLFRSSATTLTAVTEASYDSHEGCQASDQTGPKMKLLHFPSTPFLNHYSVTILLFEAKKNKCLNKP